MHAAKPNSDGLFNEKKQDAMELSYRYIKISFL